MSKTSPPPNSSSPPSSAATAALAALAEEWRVKLTPEQSAALLAYGQLLLQWNDRINLTGASSLQGLVTDHFVDSFAIAASLGQLQLPPPLRLLDVGSGGGLPALPLAVLCPAVTVQLVEPIAKKVAFLRTAIRTLALSERVQVEVSRLDAFLADRPGPFDVALSRAAFSPSDWLIEALPAVQAGGIVFALAATPTLPASPGWRPDGPAVVYAENRRWLHRFRRST